MSVRFDEAARRALDAAVVLAARHGAVEFDSGHLVAALLGNPAGRVGRALDLLGLSGPALAAELRPALASKGLRAGDAGVAVERLMRHAAGEARERKSDVVHDLDLLIAAISLGPGRAERALAEAGVTVDALRGIARPGVLTPPTGAPVVPGPAIGSLPDVPHTPAAGSRTGIGYDSHRFAPGGPLVLGGVSIDGDVHLEGHSDGDALCHAVTDAILGAAGAGDIGEMFSDRDPANRGADSVVMMAAAVRRIRDRGWRVQQVDVAVIAEEPKIAPHRAAMRARVAETLGVAPDAVSIKGKTNEGMGWIGRGEGLACIAVATLAAGAR